MKTLLGLIGYPLSHSFSKSFFSRLFQQQGTSHVFDYQNFELENIALFPDLIDSNPNLMGLNVTIPFKQSILPYLDDVTREAQLIGAVNTVWINRTRDKKVVLHGDNTDWLGFQKSLGSLIGEQKPDAIILGTGGSSLAVQYALQNMGINYRLISRKNLDMRANVMRYDQLNEETIKKNRLIINTTPLGMFPEINNAPDLPYEFLTADHFLFDLIYNPEETHFLSKGIAVGAKTKNGLEMLENQALASWELWRKHLKHC